MLSRAGHLQQLGHSHPATLCPMSWASSHERQHRTLPLPHLSIPWAQQESSIHRGDNVSFMFLKETLWEGNPFLSLQPVALCYLLGGEAWELSPLPASALEWEPLQNLPAQHS